MRTLIACAWLVLGTSGAPAETAPAPESLPPATAQPPSQPLALAPAKAVEIECFSKAVVVATDAANASTGTLRLSLLLKDASATPQTGAWRVVDVEAGHAGSFAKREMQTCAESCPLTITGDGQIQIWSPAPKGADQLGENEFLFVGVIKPANLDLRATTFNGKQIESLEEASCRIAS